MSGFSPTWLTLREPADRAARNPDVLKACAAAFSHLDTMTICDLGAGTGASVRAFAELLPLRQHWTLVDHDAGNLAAAAAMLADWADDAATEADLLVLRRGARRIEVITRVHDLAQNPQGWTDGVHLVTASAIFDLTSEPWITRLVACLAIHKTPLLATLTANGVIVPQPAHLLDARIVDAFHAHQTRDKGFGPSAGAAAGAFLERALKDAGYAVAAGDSAWRLNGAHAPLIHATLSDIATAVAETGQVPSSDLATWRAAAGTATALTIGHRDVFARMI